VTWALYSSGQGMLNTRHSNDACLPSWRPGRLFICAWDWFRHRDHTPCSPLSMVGSFETQVGSHVFQAGGSIQSWWAALGRRLQGLRQRWRLDPGAIGMT
jgi:hypothetical protein